MKKGESKKSNTKALSKKTILTFKEAFNYPFNRAKGLWNILWILVPIIGWFALFGYGVRIIQEFCKGEFKRLPIFKFKNDLKLGFNMFLKSLPFVIAYIVVIGILGVISEGLGNAADLFLGIFVIPILTINFFKKQTVNSFFEFKVLNAVFSNLGDYFKAVIKTIALAIIFILMIIILVGIPANIFTSNIFLADFYRRKVSQK